MKNNPTEQLVQSLPSYLSAHPLPSNVFVSSLTVLETSGVGSRETLQQLRQSAAVTAVADEAQVAPVAPTCHRIWVSQGGRMRHEQEKRELCVRFGLVRMLMLHCCVCVRCGFGV